MAVFGKRGNGQGSAAYAATPAAGSAHMCDAHYAPSQYEEAYNSGADLDGQSNPGQRTEYRIARNWTDLAFGGVIIWSVGYFLSQPLGPEGWDITSIFIRSFLVLAFIGGLSMALDTVTGKAKLVLDDTGMKTESIIGNKHMRWEDIGKFQLMSINYNKMVFADRRKEARGSSSKRIVIPVKAFKSQSMEFAHFMAKHRPDLFPYVPAIMKKVGAKKLVKKFIENNQ